MRRCSTLSRLTRTSAPTSHAMIDGASQTNDDTRSAKSSFIGSNTAHATHITTDSTSATQDRRHSSRLATV